MTTDFKVDIVTSIMNPDRLYLAFPHTIVFVPGNERVPGDNSSFIVVTREQLIEIGRAIECFTREAVNAGGEPS